MKTTRKRLRRVGRPNRAQASAKALAGVDVSVVDERQVLREIAADRSAPASARVSACKLLLFGSDAPQEPAEDGGMDELSRRAVSIMNRKAN